MAERDRLSQRNDERSPPRDTEGRSSAFRGGQDMQRGQRDPASGGGQGGRGEFGGQEGPYGRGAVSGAGGATAGYGSASGGYGGYGGSAGQGRGMGTGGWEGGQGGQGQEGRGASGSGHDEQAGRGAARGAEHWTDEGGTDRNRWGSGGGSNYTGPSESGWTTDAGHVAGASGYGMEGGGMGGAGRGMPRADDRGRGMGGDWRTGSGSTGEQRGGGSGWGGQPGAVQSRNRGPKGWQRSDERIHDDVCERLANESGVDPTEVTVQVSGGTITLTGSVPDRGMKYRIEDIVDGCSGVKDVDNRLRVSRGGVGALLGGAAMGMGTTTDAQAGSGTGSSRGSLLGRLFGFASGAKLADIMTRNPRTVGPEETVQKVAQLMKELDVGAIPVCTGRSLTGMVTDRDIAIRAVAAGKGVDTLKVSDVMTNDVHTCYEDDDVESALDKMGDLQVRRIPVVDHANQLVGIVSLGDFAQRETGDVEDALQDISKQRP